MNVEYCKEIFDGEYIDFMTREKFSIREGMVVLEKEVKNRYSVVDMPHYPSIYKFLFLSENRNKNTDFYVNLNTLTLITLNDKEEVVEHRKTIYH